QQSLTVRTQAAMPVEWATTMMNLATAYRNRIRGDKAQNIEDAIAAYQQSLTVRTQAAMPVEWATTMMNLANAYLNRIRGDKAQNIEDAIAAYQQSLTILTPATNPYDCLIAARGLGNLHFTQGDWQRALDEGYTLAIQAVEQTRTWASSDERKQEVLENAIGVYDNALQCYINLEQYREAILLSEQARSRHLVDLMATADLYKDGNIPLEIQQYLEEYESLQQQIDQLRRQQRSDSGQLAGTHLRFTLQDQEAVKITVKDLLQKKAEVWRKIRAKDPVLAEQLEVPHLDFDQLAKLIADQPTTAILSFYSTNDHTYIFVVRHGETGITCDVHRCEKQSKQELQLWIAQNWLIPYKVDFDTWMEQMPQRLRDLAQRLQLDQLIIKHLQGIQDLILIPHIFLHLIPFAALPVSPHPPTPSPTGGEGEPEAVILPSPVLGEGSGVRAYLGDKFRLRVVPSAQILKYCHDRENSGMAPTVPGKGFGSVEDATGDRPIVASGFEQIAQRLQIPDPQRLRGPQQATLTNYRQLTQTPHIRALHSIHHAGSDLENPMESALLLANRDRLTLGQLMAPGWRMPHLIEVFLSCCETNLGRPNVTDDIVTLSTGFLCAGARVVISTLWSVDALATALFCDFYYQFREKGCDRPTALQQAQQAMQHLSGEQLKTSYDALYQQLQQQQQQADQNRQDYRKQLKSLSESHPDYSQVKKRLEYWTRLKNDLDNALYWFEKYQNQDQPFASPYYWSGFVCQGLR
ncbi:MAG: CHAT domain-containing tetratricopeptide repeat protein, partial [Synechococcales bacterium]|nr:CHAT domain-containing tetratricopeptide repeat protein [Synechococcales bacterium]